MFLLPTEMVKNQPGYFHIISISTPGTEVDFSQESVLNLKFHNVNKETQGDKILATKEDCEKALAFFAQNGHFLVHGTEGKSRSTAIVLGYLLTQMEYGRAVKELYKIRPNAQPNLHILEIMCEITGSSYNDVISAIALQSF